MDPDVFITLALCAEVALFAICGGLFVGHEWHRDALAVGTDRRECPGSPGGPLGLAHSDEAADDRVADDVRGNGREWRSATVVDQHEARRLE